MILCSGSVHHVREIERFLRVVRDALAPNGVFVFNEYVGPCFNIYPRKQLGIVNRLLRAISPELRQAERLDQITVEQALANDCSESVRSSLILPFASTYFEFEFCHPFGGTLLHPMYPLLRHDAMSKQTPEAQDHHAPARGIRGDPHRKRGPHQRLRPLRVPEEVAGRVRTLIRRSSPGMERSRCRSGSRRSPGWWHVASRYPGPSQMPRR